MYKIPLDAMNAKNTAITKTTVEDEIGKYGRQDSDHHINECEFPNKCANCGGDHLIYARSCDSWILKKEILAIKHKNNIPYHEAQKMVAGSKTPCLFSHCPNRKYEEIVKTLIWLEPSNWESFINEIKASLELEQNDTTRA